MEETSLPLGPSSPRPVSKKKRASSEVATIAEPVFFSTVRGTLVHVQAPGKAWVRLCELGTSRAARPPLKGAHVIEFGGIGRARTQGRPFCTECLTRAGLDDMIGELTS